MLSRASALVIALLLAGPSLAAAHAGGPQDPSPLPVGEPVVGQRIEFTRQAGFSADIVVRTAGVDTRRAYVYPNGVIALEEQIRAASTRRGSRSRTNADETRRSSCRCWRTSAAAVTIGPRTRPPGSTAWSTPSRTTI